MTSNESDQKLLRDINHELDRSCDRLDAATLSQLNRIRHEAMAVSGQTFTPWRVFAASTLTACALVLAVNFFFNPADTGSTEELALSELEAMEVLSADESLEFYEDIDFYQWLSMNNEL